jgi:putative endonuclease
VYLGPLGQFYATSQCHWQLQLSPQILRQENQTITKVTFKDPNRGKLGEWFCRTAVYILFSKKDHLLYTGFTTDIENRVSNHNAGRTPCTATRRPLELIFCEFYLFEADARKREMYFKTTPGKKAIKLMLAARYKSLVNGTTGLAIIAENENGWDM